jgi:hypothetical protein
MFNMAGMELPEYLKGKNPEEIKEAAKVIRQKKKPQQQKPNRPNPAKNKGEGNA